MDNCKNCNNELNGNYCSNCGYPVQPERIDKYYIKNEIGQFLLFEKGFFYTIKELFIRPGKSINDFISKDRNRLVKPIAFLFITSLIYTFINIYFKFEDEYAKELLSEEIATESIRISKWLQDYNGYLNLIMGVFIAFWTKIFFKKYGYNFFEILILLCFLMGIEMLFSSFFGILEGITKIHLIYASMIIGTAYAVWATVHFFENRPVNYFKAFAANILGALTFYSLMFFIGAIYGVIKHINSL